MEKDNDLAFKPIGTGVFGNIYDQFKGKAIEAFEFLIAHEEGDLLGVFHRDGFGDVDLVWGNEKGGLKHILIKHVGEEKSFTDVEEAVNKIKSIIETGNIVFENVDKAVFGSPAKPCVRDKEKRTIFAKKIVNNGYPHITQQVAATSGSFRLFHHHISVRSRGRG